MAYRVRLENFEGPLDLLLFLIRKNEVDIYDIPIAGITRQFLEYLDIIQILDLETAGDAAPGFQDDDQNHRQVNAAKETIAHPIPVQDSAEHGCHESQQNEQHVGEVEQHDEVSENAVDHG